MKKHLAMSWSSSFSQTYINPENLIRAEQEVDAFMDLYKRSVGFPVGVGSC